MNFVTVGFRKVIFIQVIKYFIYSFDFYAIIKT